MEFNWSDPRKNSRLDSFMMAKAEASRMKRLSSVKSTVSNQLQPSVASKLKKKKKHISGTDTGRPLSRSHRHDLESDPSATAESSRGSNNNHYETELLPVALKHSSVFDAFDVHAAAGGLFHPASSVQAFKEHDAKYSVPYDSADNNESNDEHHMGGSTPGSSASSLRKLSTRSGSRSQSRSSGRSDTRSSDDPSLQRLPALHSRGSSSTSSSSSSRLGCGTSESCLRTMTRESSRLTSTRSDSDLNAPRRLSVVPSSADRSAIDYFHEIQEDGEDLDLESEEVAVESAPRISGSDADGELTSENTQQPGIPVLDFNLTDKFEQLKKLMKSNRDKACDGHVSATPTIASTAAPSSTTTDPSVRAGVHTKGASHKTSKPTESNLNPDTAPTAPRATKSKILRQDKKSNAQSGSAIIADATSKAISSAATKKSEGRSAKAVRVHSGTSLSELKKEHRAALAILQELGGSMDSTGTERRCNQRKQITAHEATVGNPIMESVAQGTFDPYEPLMTPPTSSRVVDRLRSSISSGRLENPEESRPTQSDDEAKGHHQQDEAEAEALWHRYAEDADPAVDSEDGEEDGASMEKYGDDDFE